MLHFTSSTSSVPILLELGFAGGSSVTVVPLCRFSLALFRVCAVKFVVLHEMQICLKTLWISITSVVVLKFAKRKTVLVNVADVPPAIVKSIDC